MAKESKEKTYKIVSADLHKAIRFLGKTETTVSVAKFGQGLEMAHDGSILTIKQNGKIVQLPLTNVSSMTVLEE